MGPWAGRPWSASRELPLAARLEGCGLARDPPHLGLVQRERGRQAGGVPRKPAGEPEQEISGQAGPGMPTMLQLQQL